MTDFEKKLQAVNCAVHEAAHVCAACSRNLPTWAEIGVVVLTELGQTGARTFHFGGSAADDLFIVYCGIEVTKCFDLGEAGILSDVADIERIAASEPDPELAKRYARLAAQEFVHSNRDVILKMAYALYRSRTLDEDATQQIYEDTFNAAIPQDFLDTVDLIPTYDWRLVPVEAEPELS